MYYIEDEVEFVNGIQKEVYGFHFISRYEIDYVNKRTEIQISSAKSKEQWILDDYVSPYVNFFELNSVPDFDEDPVGFILLELITKPSTLFYGLELKKDYEFKFIPKNDDNSNNPLGGNI